ncbi:MULTISPECIES: hypothetical protein [Enterococcus]|jgi:hypothetical protein|uniref:Uncharacterized protein n=1 Tax=Enterococcus casseliflavus TaxID=37734 RepID=A0A6N3F1T1_ENTCA|nr:MULTISPECIES: hypothetical protein [Enterococcus]MDU1990112.1 hypothetical protein [Enterococcus faecalis]EOH83442.1 hypothetical protein UAM_00865 [Enterococcus casseliflavus ATCC 49996]EOU10937.1 hypothetical protein I582_01451 [Enterococcus casseliflavus ATCC 49996]MDO0895928.1 hypothetical protein [Enterococcus sp. B1E4]MDO0906747.1 hypothetical protein [Enterococcus sp. B2E4]
MVIVVILFFVVLSGGVTGLATVQNNKLSDLYSQVSTWEKTGRTYTTNENDIGYSVVELNTENIFEVPASLPITATDYENGVLVDYDGNDNDFQVTWTKSGNISETVHMDSSFNVIDETTGKTVSSEDIKVVKYVFTNAKDKWNQINQN